MIQGSYTTFIVAEKDCLERPPDIAFIVLGRAELNAIRLAGEIRDRNLSVKIIFVSNRKENAIEAFEYGANGFLLTPFDKKKIRKLMQQNIEQPI